MRCNVYDRKKLIILRAVLIAIGGTVGGTALWQYFAFYPEVMRRELQIVVIVGSAAAFAVVLGLSAKAVYRLGASIASLFSKVFAELGAKGVVAVVAGLVTAAMLGYLFDIIIRRSLDILAVRVLADIIVAIVFAALCCFGFTKWMAADCAEEPTLPAPTRGYLLTASCFFDDRVYTAAGFLTGVSVSENVLKALWKTGADADAIRRLKHVTDGGVTVIKCADAFADAAEYARSESALAAAKRLKPIEYPSELFPSIDGAAALTAFAEPGAELIAERAVAESRVNADGADVTGRIIIDK